MISRSVNIQMNTKSADRPIALLVQMASQFESRLQIEIDNKQINMKSIMGMMSLGVENTKELTLIADGQDEEQAVSTIEEYLTKGK
ncbi:MAG: HPr family phosphocarrier protein [Anaerostipes sp.]|nr:HPr family phosphocarrier protein [Anaerostipes sp.]